RVRLLGRRVRRGPRRSRIPRRHARRPRCPLPTRQRRARRPPRAPRRLTSVRRVSESPEGLDLDALGRWLPDHVDGAGAELSAALIAGGRSNLTYVVTDGTHEWVVRRPPLGHVVETAHDMGREYRVITALEGSGVPVPATRAFCADVDVIGAPFYVMDRV